MNEILISFKNKTKIIEELLKQDNIKNINENNFLQKLSFSKKKYADIYFHSGEVNEEAILNASGSKKTIVNSKLLKYMFIDQLSSLETKLEVVYPSVDIVYEKPKDVKLRVCKRLGINTKKKLVLFTANNIKASGVQEFVQAISSLNSDNFIALIASDAKQINSLKFKLSQFDFSNKIFLLDDYENLDELYLASDIFLLPTYNKSFSLSILKAMYCKCAVFTTINNSAKELIDVFSTMESPIDRSIPFKIDALLTNKEELNTIKKQNRKIARNYTLALNLKKLNEIIQSV